MIYGCTASVLDGTERKFSVENEAQLPEEYSYESFLPNVLDQGNKSICVPCSISSWINWKKNLLDGQIKDHKVDLDRIYNIRENKKADGMQIKEALKFLRKEGDIDSYAMIGSFQVLKYAIIANGPCIGGLPVRDQVNWDFWNGSENYGGHAIAVVGYDKDGLIIRNSWGKTFGNNGYCYMPYSDFSKFFELWTIM